MSAIARLIPTVCALGACITWAGSGLSQDEAKRRCSSAYEVAQVSRRDGNLIEARKKLVYCSSFQCPQVMHGDCQHWLAEVEASIPTVVFQVETLAGPTPGPASVSIDGGDAVTLDGRAMSVNPGRHYVTFVARGMHTTTKLLVISEGQKLRRELVVLKPTPQGERGSELGQGGPAAAGAAPRSGVRITLPVVLASSVALFGGIGAAYFGLTARDGDRDLAGCSPNCTRDSVDRVKRDYLLANASLGLAAAGLATTAFLLVLELRAARTSRAAHLGLAGPLSAVGLSVSGSF